MDNAAKSKLLPVMFDILFEQIRMDVQEALRMDESLRPAVRENREIISAFYSGGLMYTLRWCMERKTFDVNEEIINTLLDLIKNGIMIDSGNGNAGKTQLPDLQES